MAPRRKNPIQRQVTRVWRRLLLRSQRDALIWCWTVGLLLSAAWFLLQPLLLPQSPVELRWICSGFLLGMSTVAAVVIGTLRAPSRVQAALLLDEQYELRERVVTALMLTPEQAGTSAGQALMADAEQRVKDLDVRSRFPVFVTWSVLAPLAAALLAGLCLLYEPASREATAANTSLDRKNNPKAAELEEKMAALKKRTVEQRPTVKSKSAKLEELEAKLEEIANKPRDTKEQLRERVKEMTSLEEAMKTREKELAEKTRSLKQQLKQLDQQAQKSSSDGPARDLEKALAEGKLDQAKEEIERLIKKLQENQLSEQDKAKLTRQMEDLQKKLERIAQQKDREEKLKQANLDPETLKREMSRLNEEKKRLQDLQDLANKLGKCQQCLKQGDLDKAAESLKSAAGKMEEMELEEQDLEDLRNSLARLQDAKDAAGEGAQDLVDPRPQDSDEPNEGGVGAGRRPLGEKGPFRSFDSKARVEFDPKGKKIFDGYAPGQNFSKKGSVELAGEIRQASQEAPEAVEQQRIPRSYRESAKGYYRRLREQVEAPAGEKK